MAIQYTPALGLPYPEVTDAPLIASRDLRALAQKMDSEGAQIRGESAAALTAGQAAEALAATALARAEKVEFPIESGTTPPEDEDKLWVDEGADETATPVTAADITDATAVGRNVLTAPLAVNARNALDIWTGTRALLDAGTDTAERTWDAKELHEYVTDQVAAGGGAASWDDLTGKPDTFPPSAHTHAVSEVTGLAARLAALEYDSDWRDVSTGLRNGTTGTLYIRRVGSRVMWRIKDYVAGTSHDFYIPPAGFLATSDANTYSATLGSVEGGFYRHQNGRLCRSIYDPPVFQGVWWESSYELAPGTAVPATLPGDPI